MLELMVTMAQYPVDYWRPYSQYTVSFAALGFLSFLATGVGTLSEYWVKYEYGNYNRTDLVQYEGVWRKCYYTSSIELTDSQCEIINYLEKPREGPGYAFYTRLYEIMLSAVIFMTLGTLTAFLSEVIAILTIKFQKKSFIQCSGYFFILAGIFTLTGCVLFTVKVSMEDRWWPEETLGPVPEKSFNFHWAFFCAWGGAVSSFFIGGFYFKLSRLYIEGIF
ncbi:uncharacterized protein LOC117109785 [Anneissia japonica]|uniref:uncharacterized protein LOC117109785 n=1 Tax=Anneissia japonica TaxID=1529436 RepID=UPI0014256288|nr:uncharacterized protein LOC117109785 [Anneissia japonica]